MRLTNIFQRSLEAENWRAARIPGKMEWSEACEIAGIS
jgi:hypothetical protein